MGWKKHLWRLGAMVLLCTLSLQLYFASRIALMRVVDPQSTTFQRSERWRLLRTDARAPWRQVWMPYYQLSSTIKRAVIASEDAGFVEHSGVDWEALEKAWERNQQAQNQADRVNGQLTQKAERAAGHLRSAARGIQRASEVTEPKIVGGSTISQQLAKNLFLTSERSLARKAQEFIITLMLEKLLSKERLLEIYLNSVEWGAGVFGAPAAAAYYYRVPADQLSAGQAARLAVMLPAPKRFQKRPNSAYLNSRALTILNRMHSVDLP